MTDLHPIFAECCVEWRGWRGADKPFQQNGYLCAADGGIIVRMKHEGEDTPDAPSVSSLRWPDDSNKYDIGPALLLEVSYAGLTTCAECKGTKTAKCHSCRGTGECACLECSGVDCSGHHECQDCDGTGEVPCVDCNDDGKAWAITVSVEVADGYGLANRYIDLLQRHSAKVYLPISRERGAPVYFTIVGGIEGLLMPMKLEAKASSSAVGAEAKNAP